MGLVKFLKDFFDNNVLMVALISWLTAQIVKAILNVIIYRKFSFERLFGDGGMPSGHSATVTAAAVVCAWTYGFNSAYFGIAFVLAIIVMHDATGVRREAGKHAVAINEIVETINSAQPKSRRDERREIRIAHLKEFVGHTHSQVLVGFILGFVIAILFCVFAGVEYASGIPASGFTGLLSFK